MSEALSRPTPKIYAMLASLILIWGTTFFLVKLAVAEVHPFIVTASRVWLAAAFIIPFAILTGRKMPKGKARLAACMAVGTFSLAIPLSLVTWAQLVVPSGIAGVYMAAIPLFVLPLAHVFSVGERMTLQRVIGFVVGFAGVLLLIGPETLAQLGSADGLAQLACLGASMSYAVGSILIRNTPKTDPIALSAVALVIACLLTLPLASLAPPQTWPSGSTLAILLWVGIISTGFAMIFRVTVISTAGSVFMSIAGYFVPITALIVGFIFGGEEIKLTDGIACALILCGIAYAQFGGKHRA